ncbi:MULTISPECIES: glycosyltransferase family 9 protein [Acidobacteriaceae]|uniref:glycosyltransferase family 9 protein n=1 Tax=Acidobacteriaceae TaxID=204434 RepID=UPI00131A946C|nr:MULTISPECIES: glycosyltransferase family 9 protein [Acidobacteriaceae]MDW5266477.1 glycosyltransferase family 9 protein [Edaphobacter sp.]
MSLKKNLMGLSAGAVMASERLLRGRAVTVDPAKVKSVLFLEYLLPLGCCVHLTPVYEAIKRSRPEITVTVATRGLGLAVLRHNSSIDHLIETPDPLSDLSNAAKTLRSELQRRKLQPDCTFTGTSDQRTRIALLSFLAGSGWRGGFTLAPQLYQRPLRYLGERSQIDNNLRLADLIGAGAGHFEPRVFFSKADVATARSMAQEINPSGKPLLILVTQGSGGQRTGWHEDRFVEVIRHAHEVLGCAIAYVGTPADTAAVERIWQVAGGIGTSLTGRTSVTELAALLALSDVVVSLDTGTMHVGRAVGVPMVVMGPSWQKPLEWLPLQVANVRILRGEDRTEVPADYKLDEIKASAVIASLTDLLQAHPANPAQREKRLQASVSEVDHRS